MATDAVREGCSFVVRLTPSGGWPTGPGTYGPGNPFVPSPEVIEDVLRTGLHRELEVVDAQYEQDLTLYFVKLEEEKPLLIGHTIATVVARILSSRRSIGQYKPMPPGDVEILMPPPDWGEIGTDHFSADRG